MMGTMGVVGRRITGFVLAMALIAASGAYLLILMKDRNFGYETFVMAAWGLGVFSWLVAGPVGRGIKSLLADSPVPIAVEPSAEFYDLQDQVQALSLEMQRMRELEDRLDFAERLLTRHGEADGPR